MAWIRPDPWRDLVPWVTGIVLLAPLCVVPLALRQVLDPSRPLARITLAVVAPGAVSCLIGCLLPVGWPAAILCGIWLGVCALVALNGLTRLPPRSLPQCSITAGMLYLPVGAAWLTASRLGIPVWQFAEPVVALTAAHFHYAGFTAPVMAGLVGARLPRTLSESGARVYLLTVLLVCVGPPLTALGITFSPALETVSALLVSGGLLLLSGLMLAVLAPRVPVVPRCFLIVSALTPLVTMAMAALYALRGHIPIPPPLLSTMAAVHGLANAVGFGACGMAGMTLLDSDAGNA